MLGVRFVKFGPMTHVIHYRRGEVVRQGRGLSFFYYAPTSSLVAVPVGSSDLPFVFNLPTADFQTVTIQGTLTYRVAAPEKLAEMLDFTVDARRHYITDDPEKLRQRLINEAQTATASHFEKLRLRDALLRADQVIDAIVSGLRSSGTVTALGVEPLGVSIVSIAPTPEMARALEAEAREALQQDADRAIYGRRNYAVEQERLIKENELNTEIAVAEKERTIRETKMNTDIAIENQRKTLIDVRSENRRKDADTRSYELEKTFRPLAEVDWRTLLAIGGELDPRTLISDAFTRLAENAERIGTLNITPDLLDSLIDDRGDEE